MYWNLDVRTNVLSRFTVEGEFLKKVVSGRVSKMAA
jgi:hypothetical protein